MPGPRREGRGELDRFLCSVLLGAGRGETGEGLIHRRAAGRLDGYGLGGELLGLDRRSGRSATGQESKGQGESEGQCKGGAS